MAAKKGTENAKGQLPIPDFIDIDAGTVSAAKAGLNGGGAGWNIPEDVAVRSKDGKNGEQHWRWPVAVTIEQAYRTVTKTGLLDAVIIVKARPGMPNEGQKEFLHFYINMAVLAGTEKDAEKLKKHSGMTDNSVGAITTLLEAVELMPKSGGLKSSLLNMMFPAKGQPGAKSPLDGKSVIANAHGTVKMVKDQTTGEENEERRIQADSFSPEAD